MSMPESPPPSPARAVQLFCTCLVNDFYPEVGKAVVELLEEHGVQIHVDTQQTCCGQPAHNAGYRDEAKRVARHTLERLSQSDDPVLVPSGSCADMLTHQTLELFRDEPESLELARAVAGRCYELSQYLVQVLGLELPKGDPSTKVAYHPSCHLSRGLGLKKEPLKLLGDAGADLVEFEDQEECCGFGGLFSAKQWRISSAMLEAKLKAIEDSGAKSLVSCDMGCLMHLAGGLHRRGSSIEVSHLAQFLRRGTP
jgi:L-lactate dehydrogenase complex protein LldE